jgi:hypothetical protein
MEQRHRQAIIPENFPTDLTQLIASYRLPSSHFEKYMERCTDNLGRSAHLGGLLTFPIHLLKLTTIDSTVYHEQYEINTFATAADVRQGCQYLVM